MQLRKKILACICTLSIACASVPFAYADDAVIMRDTPTEKATEAQNRNDVPTSNYSVETPRAENAPQKSNQPADDIAVQGDETSGVKTDENLAGDVKDSSSVNEAQSGDMKIGGESKEEKLDDSAASSAITDKEIADALAALEASDGIDTDPDAMEEGISTLSASQVTSLYGTTQYDTAAKEALYAYSTAPTVIVASGESYVDALSATALAGALGCPILLTPKSSLPDATVKALGSLGSNKIIIVGGNAVVSDTVANALSAYGSVERLFGTTQYDTQLKIYQYGKDRSLWDTQGRVIVASGSTSPGCFADALSASPLAFKIKAPVFLADDSGMLPSASKVALMSGGFKQAIIAGGAVVVSPTTDGVLQAATLKGGGKRNVVRKYGTTLYETSAELAKWAVGQGILKWEGAAFATSGSPYDALAGSVVQGKEGSVLLIAGQGNTSTATAIKTAGGSVSNIKFFGGTSVITWPERVNICSTLGIEYIVVDKTASNISLNKFAQIEAKASDSSTQDVLSNMNPANSAIGSASFYQFAVLSDGYSGMPAAQLDKFIASKASYSEKAYGVTSKMRGTGAYFVAAAKQYNINEVYLVSHAALESAWGCSKLAQGSVAGYKGYLNFYGIGAYDLDPNNGGAALAKSKGWTTPEKAILGAAQWISSSYVHPTVATAKVSGDQNTLWRMKWDVRRAATAGDVWHQYATSITWATGISSVMSEFYAYNGISLESTKLRFEIPTF